jgi:hypothetical protein
VLNTCNAADYIITPVLLDLFSYNAAAFMADVLPRDVEGLKNWFVLVNGYNKRYEEAKSGRQNDFLKLYQERGFPLTPKETWLPWTANIHMAVDYQKKLTAKAGLPGAVYCPELFNAIAELAGCFFDDDFLKKIPEAF